MSPALAVLIPVYGAPEGLARTLRALAACADPFDLVVVDDGSEPPVQVGDQVGGHAVTLLRHGRNRGIEAALNTGLACVLDRGYTYVARLDAGDVATDDRFAEQVAFLDANPEHALVGGYVAYEEAGGRPLYTFAPPTTHEGILRAFHYNNYVAHPSATMRVSALRAVGGYTDRYPGAEDYDLFLRIASRFKVANLPKVLLRYEVGPGQISQRIRHTQILSRIRLQARHFDPVSPHSYLGILMSLAAFFVPRRLVLAAKSMGR